MINEFSDLFLDELTRIPLKGRSTLLLINYQAHNPYLSLPIEWFLLSLKKLKDQLKDLLDKGFLGLNASPWGALILFVKKKRWNCENVYLLLITNKMTIKNKYPLLKIDDLF